LRYHKKLYTVLKSAQSKWLIGVSAFTFLSGTFLIVCSFRTAEHAQGLPRMTCDDLIRNGPGANRFITLTDVYLCSAGDAFREDMDRSIEMYVPVFSDHLKQEPKPADIALLLEVLDDRDRERLLERPDVGELNVELWTPAGQLDPWVFDRLGAIYPGIQLAKCRVLSVGLHEPSALHARSELHEGMILVFVAVACQLGRWIWRGSIKLFHQQLAVRRPEPR
jgi:hypothetical protein